jgi:hypothetical protein
MALLPEPPYHRHGVRFSSDETHDKAYLQGSHDNDPGSIYRGELFLNETLDEIYYVDSLGTARRFGDESSVPVNFSRIDFTGLRDFADDIAAAAASPAVPIGGMYRTDNVLKVRIT